MFDKFTNIVKFEKYKSFTRLKNLGDNMEKQPLKLIPPADQRVQSAIAPFNDEMLKEHAIKIDKNYQMILKQ